MTPRRRRCPLWELVVAMLVAAALVLALVRATEADQTSAAAGLTVPSLGAHAPAAARRPGHQPGRLILVPRARLRAAITVRRRLERRLTWHGRRVRALRRQLRLLRVELRQARHVQSAHPVTDWVAKQIAAAETIARESSGDPWPNCPDPYDGSSANWGDTVACENSGQWMDTPGYYRCGLQFDPGWERRFGRLCP